LGVGDRLVEIRELLGGDVLLFVDLPDLVLALVGQAGVLGFFDFDPEFFELGRQPVGGLGRGVVLAPEILLDVIL